MNYCGFVNTTQALLNITSFISKNWTFSWEGHMWQSFCCNPETPFSSAGLWRVQHTHIALQRTYSSFCEPSCTQRHMMDVHVLSWASIYSFQQVMLWLPGPHFFLFVCFLKFKILRGSNLRNELETGLIETKYKAGVFTPHKTKGLWAQLPRCDPSQLPHRFTKTPPRLAGGGGPSKSLLNFGPAAEGDPNPIDQSTFCAQPPQGGRLPALPLTSGRGRRPAPAASPRGAARGGRWGGPAAASRRLPRSSPLTAPQPPGRPSSARSLPHLQPGCRRSWGSGQPRGRPRHDERRVQQLP